MKRFAAGLSVRLVGLALIWLGDGSPEIWRKAIVILGVGLSIGGIAMLRYMLFQGLRRKPRNTPAPREG
jgi:hypothetical protein